MTGESVEIALKEWRAVCDALAAGRQSILLRKGGIQEGPGGFTIAHRRFALLPTRLHQKPEMLKPEHRGDHRGEPGADPEPPSFRLTHAAEITDILTVDSRPALDRLDALHVWAEPYLEMRWNYRPDRPLFLLIVRAYALAEPLDLRNTYAIAGCRSWVPLPSAAAVAVPVLDDAAFADQRGRVLGRVAG